MLTHLPRLCPYRRGSIPPLDNGRLCLWMRIIAAMANMRGWRPDEPLHVGFLTPTFTAGGVERWYTSLAKFTPELRWHLGFGYGAQLDPNLVRELAPYSQIYATTPSGAPGLGTDADEFLSTPRLDDVQAVMERVADNVNVLVLWTSHGFTAYPDKPSENLLDKWPACIRNFEGPIVCVAHGGYMDQVLPIATRYTAVSGNARDRYYPEKSQAACEIIRSGIEFDRLTPRFTRAEVRDRWDLSGDKILVGHVGRWDENKRPRAVADAVMELGEPYWAVFVSGSDDASALEYREVLYEASGKRAIFIPPTVYMGDVYQGLDCLMITSVIETGPLVAMEAWASGLPVVSTPVGLIPDLEEEVGGRLVYSLTPSPGWTEMAAVVRVATESRDSDISTRARAFTWAELSAHKMAAAWSRLFRAVAVEYFVGG